MKEPLRGLSAIVVGAGFGGLAAAAHLARQGARVVVVEQAKEVGGKAAFLERDGFSFDTGPTLLTMPDIVRETFAAAGADVDAVVPLIPLDPLCRYVLPDGRDFFMYRDAARTEASIARVLPDDAPNWRPFLDECASIWEAVGEPYLGSAYDGPLGFAQRLLRKGPRALKLGTGFSTLCDLGRRYFRSDVMRAVVGRFATYAGGAPSQTSAAFGMVVHVEAAFGAYYPRGGMNALARALASALRERGVEIHTGTRVEALTFEGGRATGVVVVPSGEGSGVAAAAQRTTLAADLVVCDVDPLAVARHLLPEAVRRSAKRALAPLEERSPSLSGFAWVFGVEGDMPRAAHHNVLFPADYDHEFEAIFERGKVAADPTIYVSVPTVTDPSRAPEGCHSVFCLLNAPPTAATEDWGAEAVRLRAIVRDRLERHFAPGFGARIRAEAFVSPRDIARTGAVDGAIYGGAPHGSFAPFERPRNRAEYARGLYFVGGATHPGGGVPIVMRGGRFAAELAAQDFENRGTTFSSLRARPRPWFSSEPTS